MGIMKKLLPSFCPRGPFLGLSYFLQTDALKRIKKKKTTTYSRSSFFTETALIIIATIITKQFPISLSQVLSLQKVPNNFTR